MTLTPEQTKQIQDEIAAEKLHILAEVSAFEAHNVIVFAKPAPHAPTAQEQAHKAANVRSADGGLPDGLTVVVNGLTQNKSRNVALEMLLRGTATLPQ